MFDPTAFDNIKVVIEGLIYDRDLDGEISIIDRNDLVNLAKMSRTYEIVFTLRGMNKKSDVSCLLKIESALENLAAEIMQGDSSEKLQGANIQIDFLMKHLNESELHDMIEDELTRIWGSKRKIKQKISLELYKDTNSNEINKTVSVEFNRLIMEENIDDLISMFDYILLSLEKLERIIA